MTALLLAVVVAWLYSAGAEYCKPDNTVLFVPLDERFTTRDIVLNLNGVTDYCLVTPEPELISSWKTPAPLEKLHSWVEENIALASTAIISAEMYLYGSLINSRISNDTTTEIRSRIHKLIDLKRQHGTNLYISTVVMRIPSYNGDFEEPWYWTQYGSDI